MVTLNYIIADDDELYREVITQQLELIPGLECLASCSSAIEASSSVREKNPDLLILDVEMPGLTGIDFVKTLTRLPLVIFISSHPTYAVDAFDLDAVDYLVKPVSTMRLMKSIEKAKTLSELKKSTPDGEGFKSSNEQSFFIKEKNAFIKINYEDVLYIQSLGDFVNIFLTNGEKKIVLVSMKNIEQQLPGNVFLRISRTHIVNKDKITAVETSMIALGKLQLPVGKTYNDTVIKAVVGNTAVKRFL
ncbi:MAG: response regulator transcription factor [Chitinophagaceae bacterium]|nr:MAG: response regulator transcription factor [Chitinophagaceae bacterium]